MSIYCNVKNCVSWKSIDTPVQQTHGIGYVPVGGLGLYKGKCKLNSVSVYPKIVKSGTGRRQVLSICSNFSESVENLSSIGSCSQTDCLHNEGLACARLSMPDKDLFFDTEESYDGNVKVSYPVCKSYSIRHRTGVVDWSRAYATS